MPVYIQSAQAISPQDSFQKASIKSLGEGEAHQVQVDGGTYYNCIHPDYKTFIKASALRRMSPVIRMGLACSKVCMQEAGLDQADAILVGSGLGCVRDTAKFLNQVIDNQELLLNPTAFIQSTHNTVSGQIALLLNCRAHNLTFSQNSLSFETALLEATMLLKEEGFSNVLLGGLDELVEESYLLMQKNDCARAALGEGSSFFVLSDQESDKSMARVDALEIKQAGADGEDISARTLSFLSASGLKPGDIDVFISGRNGDERYDGLYETTEKLLDQALVVNYKDLVGEYHTASAFAMYLAARILGDNNVPPGLCINQSRSDRDIRRVLILNQSKGQEISWILLSHPKS
jgi:3-oxoacyl-(acyl-carrier-protein) synthase